MSRNTKGFTLIELLVVIGIIGILSTIAAVSFTSAQGKARDAKRLADVRGIQTALELYNADHGGYPAVAAGGVALGAGTNTALSNAAAAFGSTTAAPVYLAVLPTPPNTATLYWYQGWKNTNAAAETSANECTTGPCAGYHIIFGLENPTPQFSRAVCANAAAVTGPNPCVAGSTGVLATSSGTVNF